MERMGLKDGVWICNFEEFKGLSAVLRDTVVRLYEVAIPQENKGEKMVMLYDFLTSGEFKSYMEAILEGFTQMKADLEKEKRAMTTIWQQREKQIEKVSINTSRLYGSFKGIAGNAVLSVPQLELNPAYLEAARTQQQIIESPLPPPQSESDVINIIVKPKSRYKKDMLVRHDTFGEGAILKVEDSGTPKERVLVKFRYDERWIMTAYTNLSVQFM